MSSVSVKFEKCWLTFDDSTFTFMFDGPLAQEKSAGNYMIPITLTDQYGASSTFKQNIIVLYDAITNTTNTAQTEPKADS